MRNKQNFIVKLFSVIGIAILLSGCSLVGLDAQNGYDYKPVTLDPHINISARKFLEDRANGVNNPTDTIFRWMLKGIQYAGIDLAEYEKPGRTFIFLHNDAVRIRSTAGVITANVGIWGKYPIVDAVSVVNGITVYQTHIARSWEEYPKEDVKNYFLYLIGQGEYNFYDLNSENKIVQSLLPSNSITTKKSMLGYENAGLGFDQEGKFTLKLQNKTDSAPIMINDGATDRSGGYISTNGIVHVFGSSTGVPPPGIYRLPVL